MTTESSDLHNAWSDAGHILCAEHLVRNGRDGHIERTSIGVSIIMIVIIFAIIPLLLGLILCVTSTDLPDSVRLPWKWRHHSAIHVSRMP